MVVYYSQILNKTSKKILTGDFSATGAPLKENKMILLELKQVISSVNFSEQKIYSFTSKSGSFTFYFTVDDSLIMGAVSDDRTPSKVISKYFEELSKEFRNRYSDLSTQHYEFDDPLRSLTDTFNKRSKFLKGAEELEEAHSVLVENLDSLINRGENINNLKDMADKIGFETREMSRKVSKMKRDAQIEKYKIYGVFALVLIVLIYFFFMR